MPRWGAQLRVLGLAVLAVALALFPWGANGYLLHVTIIAIYYAMLASSWALVAGQAGQFSFAHMAFAALGGYTSALLVQHTGVPTPIGVLAGIAMAAVAGALIGWLCLRIGGPYLALFTLAFAVIFQLIIIAEYQFTRGSLGLPVEGLFSGNSERPYYYTALVLLAASLAAMYWMMHSRIGLFLQAIREDEDAARACGVDTARYKIIVFTLTSGIAGLAGAFYGLYVGILTPNLVTLPEMGLIVAMAVIGGIESLAGAVIGAIIVYIASEELRAFGQMRWVLLGVAIMLTQRFAQNGLVAPLVERLTLLTARTAAPTKKDKEVVPSV